MKNRGIGDVRNGKRASRAGSANYNEEDVETMLNVVEEVETLGANNWSEVAHRFCEWAQRNCRPAGDLESLRNKFYKLANARTKTGDPSCTPAVRRANHIARAIQAKCWAYTLAESSEEDVKWTSEERENT